MGVPGWTYAIVIGAFFFVGGIIIGEFSQTENDLFQRVSDAVMIFGGIIIAIAIGIIAVSLVKRR